MLRQYRREEVRRKFAHPFTYAVWGWSREPTMSASEPRDCGQAFRFVCPADPRRCLGNLKLPLTLAEERDASPCFG